MKRARGIIVLFLAALAAIWSMPEAMRAQSTNQAALVVRHGEDDVRAACVEFDEPQISGYELLQRSGAQLQLDVQGIGALVCSIDETGCPPDDCLCHCKGGGDCIYWSYWHQMNGTWQYSQGGSSVYMVAPGDIEGWSWGPGAVNQAVPPPDLTFEDVCQTSPTDTPTPSPTATNTKPPLLISPAATATRNIAQAATVTLTKAVATDTPAAQSTATHVATMTPAPSLPQTTATAAPTQTSLPPEFSSPVQLATVPPPAPISIEGTVQGQEEAGGETVEKNAKEAPPTMANVETATPAAVAVAQRSDPAGTEIAPLPNTQKVSAPTAEPTAPLRVIGEGVVPAAVADSGDPDISDQNPGTLLNADSFPYLVFVFIVIGLAGFMGFVSLRRRLQN